MKNERLNSFGRAIGPSKLEVVATLTKQSGMFTDVGTLGNPASQKSHIDTAQAYIEFTQHLALSLSVGLSQTTKK